MSLIKEGTTRVDRSVGDPSTAYMSLKPIWKKTRAVLQGIDNVKAHDEIIARDGSNILVPFSNSMTQEQYNFFKSEAELPGITGQFAKVLISSLLRKESHFDLPEEIMGAQIKEEAEDWIKNDFTIDGQSLFSFLDQALWEELQTSRAWVFVDYPEIDPVIYDSLDPEELARISPYPALIKAENVINYQTRLNPLTGQRVLSRVVLRYIREEYLPEKPWHPEYLDTVADYYIDESGGLVIDYYSQSNSGLTVEFLNGIPTISYIQSSETSEFEHYKQVMPQKFGERLREIPAWPLNGMIEPVEPVLSPLVNREIALYNKVSRRNHLLYGASTFTPVVSSDMSDEEFDSLTRAGLGAWLRVRQGDDIKVLETPTAALADMDRAIAATVDEMARMGIRMLSPESAQSGVALEIRNASQQAQLGTLNSKVSKVMGAVIAFMVNWKYNLDLQPDDVEFSMSSDFSPIAGGEGAMRLVSEWYQQGLISRSTFVRVAKFNDFLPADYDDEEAVGEIQTDPLLAQPPSPEAQVEIEE